MAILGLLKKIKTQTTIFEKHPCRELDLETKVHYLNGLTLLAKEDDDICEKEKEYLSILINTFDLTGEKLEEVIDFANNPDEDTILEMIECIKQQDIKYCFIFGCIVLANIDESFDDNEKLLIKQYAEMLKISKSELLELHEIFELLYKKDKTNLYRFINNSSIDKDNVDYLFDYFKIECDFKLTDDENILLAFNFEKPSFDYGNFQNATEIMSEPISKEQYCIFLNYMYEENKIKIDELKNIVTVDNVLLVSRENGFSKIIFYKNNFIIDDVIKEERITCITIEGAQLFVKWINEIFNMNYRLPEFFSSNAGYLSTDNISNFMYEFYMYKNYTHITEEVSHEQTYHYDTLISYGSKSRIKLTENYKDIDFFDFKTSFRMMR